jgi:hypothetical protein
MKKTTILKWEEFEALEEKKSSKKVPYEKSGLEKPNLADLNKDKKISGYEKARGSAIEKAIGKSKKSK